MGPGFGKEIGDALVGLIVLAFIAGVVVAVPAVLLAGWVLRHLTVGWQ